MNVTERFAREYQQYNELTPARRKEQIRLLKELEADSAKEATACGPEEIRSFLASLSEPPASNHPNTVRKKLNAIKPFFRWAWENDLVPADTYLKVKQIAPPAKSSARGLPRPYKRPELDQFYAELDAAYPWLGPPNTTNPPDYFWKRFEKGTTRFRRVRREAMRAQIDAIVALALHCGLRRQEIYDCSIADIHPDNEYVVVRSGKGERPREVPHTDESRAAIQKWLELRHRLNVRTARPWLKLWGVKKKDWSAPMTFFLFEKMFLKLGSGWELHRFRHTCGTEWLRSTGRIELVKKLLGHSNITMTEGYAEVVRDDLADAMNKAQRQFGERVGQVVEVVAA